MSQSDTYVPGVNGASGQAHLNSLYSRQQQVPESNGFTANGTYIPGMKNESVPHRQLRKENDAEPVVGFLYSISRMGIGEYWPLHLGTNTIGRSSSCDIQLKEASVSDNHAMLSIKRMKSTQALIASVRDTGSKNGMYLNDEELDYDNHTCKNSDVLTIGSCYKLLLVLVNPKDYGLTIAEDFVEYEDVQQEPASEILPDTSNDTYSRKQRVYSDDCTVDLNGNKSFVSPGETKIM